MRFEERIRALLRDVANILNILVIDEYEAESFWHIALDADTIFFAEVDQQRGVLVLSCDVGSPTASRRLELYDMMLNYNHHWNATAGTRLSLLSSNGAVWVWSDFAVDHLDRDLFAAWLDDYRTKIKAWRSVISQGDQAESRFEDMPEFFESKGFIRG
jgi:hypothetical protein